MSTPVLLAVAGATAIAGPSSAWQRLVSMGLNRGWGVRPVSARWGAIAAVRRRVSADGGRSRRRSVLAAVRVLVAELEAGARPPAALHAAAELAGANGAVFRRAAELHERGDDAAGVLRAEPDLAVVAYAWAVSCATGVAPAEVLAGAARDLAASEEQDRAVAAALAGARASATIMALLPMLGLGLGAAMGARPVPMLIGSGPGHVAFVAGLALELLGVLWTRRIAAGARRPC